MSLKKILLLLTVFVCTNSFSQSLNSGSSKSPVRTGKNFDGFYLGVTAGIQNIFGGSLVDGKDLLAQKSGFVSEATAGYRKQFFENRWQIGVEFQFGITDGNLMYKDPQKNLNIVYKNNSQRGLGLTTGYVVGKNRNILLFAYLNETKRTFDVTITDQFGPYKQKDKQGMMKYGIGIETPVYKMIHIRASFGGVRADFGERITNINVNDRQDIMAGFVFQL